MWHPAYDIWNSHSTTLNKNKTSKEYYVLSNFTLFFFFNMNPRLNYVYDNLSHLHLCTAKMTG